METLLYNIVMLISRIHSYFLTLNDQSENSFTDKELHFIIIGCFGIALILVLHPIFLWLARTGHTMGISFFYVATVILVLTFAIEIGQSLTGTGTMEFGDVVAGMGGFFAVTAVIVTLHLLLWIVKSILRAVRRAGGHQRRGAGV